MVYTVVLDDRMPAMADGEQAGRRARRGRGGRAKGGRARTELGSQSDLYGLSLYSLSSLAGRWGEGRISWSPALSKRPYIRANSL